MARALFRIALPDGQRAWASGDTETGPHGRFPSDVLLSTVLAQDPEALAALAESTAPIQLEPDVRIIAPVEDQDVWAAGVTYLRSRDARMAESASATVYDRVYDSVRPELFFKDRGSRVRGPGERVGIRADSVWDVPEPELTLVITAGGRIAGFTIGNDMSSRSIEGENPLYLPQAKLYAGACALGPCIVPAAAARLPLAISIAIHRGDVELYRDSTSTANLARKLDDLVEHLLRALPQPGGVFLLTGTGIVPDDAVTLQGGDVVTIAVDGIGELRNIVEVVG